MNRLLEEHAKEGFHILDEYGLQAYLDLSATGHDHDLAIRHLNKMKEYFLNQEDYMKCAKIQDCINVLWVDGPQRQGLKRELEILI